ncbi:MAG: hypothetical protein ACPL06_02835 [Candidatus Anstonellales archaeon]
MNFKKFAEEKFGISFPKNIVFEEKKEGVRAFAKTLMPINIKGKRGIVVYGDGPTDAFARTFGKLATKNTIDIDEAEAKNLLQNKKIKNTKNLAKNEYFIVFFKNHAIAVIFCDGDFLIPRSGKKFLPTNEISEKIRKI